MRKTGTFDYLGQDFSKKGILKDKEVWGFNPSSITVYQGDTVDITLYNPSSDPHTFTVMELGVNVPVQAEATAQVTFVASKVGTFHYMCAVEEHDPFMWGQLVVLPRPTRRSPDRHRRESRRPETRWRSDGAARWAQVFP